MIASPRRSGELKDIIRAMGRIGLLAPLVSVVGALMLMSVRVLSHERVNTTVSYDKEIVRIVTRKCLACHSSNNLGVPLTTYEQTRPWARAIEEEVLRRRMPPWRAVPGYGEFANDAGLTTREVQFLISWIEGNGPKTKDQRFLVNIGENRTPEGDRLRLDTTRWQLGEPDLLKTLPANVIAPGEGNAVRRVTVDLGLSAERWVRALELKPGDRRVVRAAFFSLEETGQWLGSWTPWHATTSLPANVAYRLKPGSRVVVELHYQAASEEVTVTDQGSLGLYYAEGPAMSPTDLTIPTTSHPAEGEDLETASGTITLSTDLTVLALKPDVPPGVQAFEITARKRDGTTRVLLVVRDALAEWPTPYIYRQPQRLPAGTELRVIYYATPGADSFRNGPAVIASVIKSS